MCAASSSWHSSLDSQPHRLYRRVGSLHPSSASSDPPCAGKLRFRLDNPGCTAVHVAGSSVAAASQALSLVMVRVQFHPLFVRERSLGGWRRATPPPNRARSPSNSLFELENNPSQTPGSTWHMSGPWPWLSWACAVLTASPVSRPIATNATPIIFRSFVIFVSLWLSRAAHPPSAIKPRRPFHVRRDR